MIKELKGQKIIIHSEARLADNASLIGAVTLEKGANIWYGATLRGDCGAISVGENSAVEDNCVLHGEVRIGKDCVIGHGAILHGCTLEDGVLIGMGATVMDGAIIGAGSMVAAGALVTKHTLVPPGSLVMGMPARVKGPISAEQTEELRRSAEFYRKISEIQLPAWQNIK